MEDWLNNMGDWCISRKRFWGLPLPIWRCKNDHETFISSKKELESKAISGLPLQELHRPWIDDVKIKCPECNETAARINDVGDCWLDAGIVPFSTLNYLNDKKYWQQWYPADLVIEMREQIRLWFYSLLFMSVVLQDKAPYKNVFTYEKVHDETGRPMHKSWGNAIWFDEGVEKMGADVMRWIYTEYYPHQNLNFGYKGAKEAKQTLMTVFNLREYLKDYLVSNNFKSIKLKQPEDLWMISRLNGLIKSVTENLDALRPNLAVGAIKNFFLEDLSRTYIQFIRERINNDDEKKEVVYVLYNSLFELLKLLAPFTPFLSEKIYQETFRNLENKESIHLFFWPTADEKLINAKLEAEMEVSKQAIQAILAAREKAQLGLRWPVKEVVVECDKDSAAAIKSLQKTIKTQTNIKVLLINSNIPEMDIEILPNHKALGPKFGSLTPQVIEHITSIKPNKLLAELKKGIHQFTLNSETLELREEDITVRKEVPEPHILGEFKYGHIYLNKERDSELEEEGYVRELMRRIQAGRNDAQLVKADKIRLFIKTDMAEEFRKWMDQIQQKVGADTIEISTEDSSETYEHHFDEKIKEKEFYVEFSKD